jgi:hypothetical protein
MKNIHILPTDKPTYLYEMEGKLHLSDKFEKGNEFWHNQNIYITSDEEIKEGDWFIDDNRIFKCNDIKIGYWNFGESNNSDAICSEFRKHEIENCKKIILTTDQDLIADGVQAIDDKFLEWFVKNPSCEEVEVEKGYRGVDLFNYKIIIPE